MAAAVGLTERPRTLILLSPTLTWCDNKYCTNQASSGHEKILSSDVKRRSFDLRWFLAMTRLSDVLFAIRYQVKRRRDAMAQHQVIQMAAAVSARNTRVQNPPVIAMILPSGCAHLILIYMILLPNCQGTFLLLRVGGELVTFMGKLVVVL